MRIFNGLCGFLRARADPSWRFSAGQTRNRRLLALKRPLPAGFGPRTIRTTGRKSAQPVQNPHGMAIAPHTVPFPHRPAAIGREGMPSPGQPFLDPRPRRSAATRLKPAPAARDGQTQTPAIQLAPKKSPCGTRVKHRSQTHTLTYNPFSIDSTSVDKESGTGGTEKVKSVLVERLEKTPEQEGSKIRCRENPIVAADVARSQLDTELDIRIRI